jgi:hypothetical protein
MYFIFFFLVFIIGYISTKNQCLISLIKTFVTSVCSTYLYLNFPTNIDQYNGSHPTSLLLFHFALGYFIFELVITIYEKKHFSALIHAILSICSFLLFIIGFYPKYGLFCLSFDISSIFLNLVYQSDAIIWKILFITSFFVFRILFGTIESIKIIKQIIIVNDNYLIPMVVLNILFVCLNYYWFYKIIKKALKLNSSKIK